MLKAIVYALGFVGICLVGYSVLESATKKSILSHEKSYDLEKVLLDRGYDILVELPSNSSDGVKLIVRQDYWRKNGVFGASRGLYSNSANTSFLLSAVALKVPDTLSSTAPHCLNFTVDRSKVHSPDDLLAVAGPFLASSIPVEALMRRKESFHRILILGSGIGAVSGFYQTHASAGSILIDAVESNKNVLATAKRFFGVESTSRVKYFNEELLQRVDIIYKNGIQYDAIHVSACDPNSEKCPMNRPDKLALILIDKGSLTVSLHKDMVKDGEKELMKKLNDAFKSCFQVGSTMPVQVIFCKHQNVTDLNQMITEIKVNAADFDLATGLDSGSLIML